MHIPAEEGGDGDEGSRGKRRMRMVVDAFAGALAGCVSRVIVGPLDVIKIRFQVQLEPIRVVDAAGATLKHVPKYTGIRQAIVTIFKEEGIQGLWRGTVPGLMLTIPYTGVQFVALHQAKQMAAQWGLTGPEHPLNSFVSFGSGALAGAAGTVASYPFDLLRTTMAAQGEPPVYRNVVEAAKGIVRERGVSGLYRGLGVTVIEIMPYAALQFGLYDQFRLAWASAQSASHKDGSPSAAFAGALDSPRLAAFVCGLTSGLCAKLASHPLDVAKKRFQVAGLQRSLAYGQRVETGFALQSLGAGIAGIYRAEGVAGLWKGSVPSILKAAPAAAITFTAYEIILGWMLAALPVDGAQPAAAAAAAAAARPQEQGAAKGGRGKGA